MALPSCLAKCVRFAMGRRIVFLHTPIVAAPEQVPLPVKQGRADRDPPFSQPLPGFRYGNLQHGVVVEIACHIFPLYDAS